MKSLLHCLCLLLLTISTFTTPSTSLASENLEQRVLDLEAQIEALADVIEERASDMRSKNSKLSIGGYGELHYNNLAAEDSTKDVDEFDFHRFVLFFAFEFSDGIRLVSELELEHALSGDGKEGEVELEQAYLEFNHSDSALTQAGVFLIPVGILNETHEPTTFYGVERNPVENIIIPATWWEAGVQHIRRFGQGWQWNIAAHSGLDMPTDSFRIRSGRQKVSKANAKNLAATSRIKYTGISGLEMAISFQVQTDPSQQNNDGLDKGRLAEAHLIYNKGRFGLRSLYASWNFSGYAIETTTGSADSQNGWYIEPSFKLNNKLGIYLRTSTIDAARNQDNIKQNEIGLNWWPHPKVVIKADWREREHSLAVETGRDFRGFDLGMGYHF